MYGDDIKGDYQDLLAHRLYHLSADCRYFMASSSA